MNDHPPPTGNGRAVLHEIATLLETLARTGAMGAIDLARLPLNHADRREIRDALGTGAVRAEIQAEGATVIQEARYPGVWFVTHHNEAGTVITELIEVCAVPAILPAPAADIHDAASRLAAELAA